MLSVLTGIYDNKMAKFTLKSELETQTDDIKKANLQKALEEFEKIEEKTEQK